MFLMKSESFLTLYRQKVNFHSQGPEKEPKETKSNRNEYYFVVIVNIICCFKNKEDYFIFIHFHVHLRAACVLDQK